MSRHSFTRSTFLLLFALVISACGGDDDDDDGPFGPGDQVGEMDADVSGDVNESVSGSAILFDDGTGEAWTLFMGPEEQEESSIWFGGEGNRPGTGVHAFEAQSGTFGAFYLHGASEEMYVADEGVLTVTTATSSRYAGSFEFTATDLTGEKSVTIEGSFDAEVYDEEF